MQFSDSSAATKDLTRSFGWDTYDSFTQHDVLEFNNVLCEKLEEKMTPGETSFSGISGDQSPSPLFMTPGPAVTQTPAKKVNNSFSSTAPTPKMKSSSPAGNSKPEKKVTPTSC